MTAHSDAVARAPLPGDRKAVQSLVRSELADTPYIDRVVELLASAEHGDPECRQLVIERDGSVLALALFGPVAGALDVWRISAIVLAPEVEPRDVGRPLIDALVESARTAGARLLVAELPADPALGRSLSLLRANQFHQEGRVPDFYRDGVALLFLRREL